MKIIKNIGLLLILSLSTNLWSMSQLTSTFEEKEEKEGKEKSENNQIFKLEFPGDTTEEEIIDVNREDSISLSTFAELMDMKLKENEPYILARVVTKEKDRLFTHYYDAHILNHYLFGKYPLQEKMDQLKVNPANQENIIALEYFTIKKGENTFKYLCSNNDLFNSYRKQDLLDFFYLNSNDFKLKIEVYKKYLESKNNKKIEKYIEANHRLAHMHYNNKNYKEALKYLEAIAIPEAPKDSAKIWIANVLLVNIYYSMDSIDKTKYEQLKKYCEVCLANPGFKDINLNTWAKANYLLGNIYYNGLGLTIPDHNKAEKHFQLIIKTKTTEKIDLATWINTNTSLMIFYYYREPFSMLTFQKYEECCHNIITDQIKNFDLETWITTNYKLACFYAGRSKYNKLGIDYRKALTHYKLVLSTPSKNIDQKIYDDTAQSIKIIENMHLIK